MRNAKVLCAALVAAGCFAQTTATRPQTREITLLEGRGELITFQQDVSKVAISEPKIADAIVISPREVMINAKGPGRTTLVIWETGADPATRFTSPRTPPSGTPSASRSMTPPERPSA
jgi:Flp pilus assembly secretin CpaC